MILIAKDAFYGPKKFFCEDLLQSSITYDDTLLSCKKSEKIKDPILNKVTFFGQNLPKKIYLENRALSHLRVYSYAPLCKK